METEDISFYERVRQGYLKLADTSIKIDLLLIDASQSLESVQKLKYVFHLDYRLLE